MDSVCTWLRCDIRASHPYLNRQGVQWANLCGVHSLQLDTALASANPRMLLSAWVKASGGAEKLTASMKPEREVAARFLSEWSRATKEPTEEGLHEPA